MAENRKISGFYLSAYQYGFVEKFLNPNSAPNHLLHAPVGSGKTITSSAIIYEMVKSGAKRILILVPALVLVDQYKKVLSEIAQDITVVSLSRKIVREIETLKQVETFWARSISIVSLQMAASEEIKKSILSVQWDLIIIDEVEHVVAGSKHASLIKMMIEEQIAKRILILSNLPPTMLSRANKKRFLNSKLFDNFETTNWNRRNIFSGQSIREVKFTIINYERTKDEVSFIKKYTNLSKWLLEKNFQNKIRSRLVSSSLYAAEESLRSLRNRLVHDDLNSVLDISETGKEFVKDEELLGDTNLIHIDKKLSKKDFLNLKNDLSLTFDLLDEIQVDSKFNALLKVIKDIQNKKQNTWIYASYQSTISYLHSSLSETSPNIYQIHGQMPSRQASETIQRFRDEGGILIASTSLLKGVDLPLDSLVLYDIPESENLMYVTFTRLSNPSRKKTNEPLSIFVFDDISKAQKSEQGRLRKLQGFLQKLVQEEM
ncbi:MAG: DEAD/DEAH box helicase family protein [Anaerolineales bacterium]